MSDIADKWGKVIAERGFAQVPNYLLLLNTFIDPDKRLSPAELLILIQLVGSWWSKGAHPFPSVRTLAVRCGVSERQVQRALRRLEELNLVKRVSRRTAGLISSNAYDLTPLVSVLQEVAKAFPNKFPRQTFRGAQNTTPAPVVDLLDQEIGGTEEKSTEGKLKPRVTITRPHRKLLTPKRKPPDLS